MSEGTSWTDQVKTIIADRAYSLNYDEGMQCRFMPVASQEGSHTLEIHLEMTHSGHPFDLTWFVRYSDIEGSPIQFELVAPADQGGTLWSDQFNTLDRLKRDAEVLPVFIRGYFVGRRSVQAILTAPTGAPPTAAEPAQA